MHECKECGAGNRYSGLAVTDRGRYVATLTPAQADTLEMTVRADGSLVLTWSTAAADAVRGGIRQGGRWIGGEWDHIETKHREAREADARAEQTLAAIQQSGVFIDSGKLVKSAHAYEEWAAKQNECCNDSGDCNECK